MQIQQDFDVGDIIDERNITALDFRTNERVAHCKDFLGKKNRSKFFADSFGYLKHREAQSLPFSAIATNRAVVLDQTRRSFTAYVAVYLIPKLAGEDEKNSKMCNVV